MDDGEHLDFICSVKHQHTPLVGLVFSVTVSRACDARY
jgi:hypothetical protein